MNDGEFDAERWVQVAQGLAARFSERAAEHDRDASFPFENFADMREAGLLALTVPRAYGGHEVSLTTFLRVQEALAHGDGATAMAVNMHLKLFGAEREGAAYPKIWFDEMCRGAVQDGWLCNTVASEEGLGSPAGGGVPETVARPVEGGWLLNGRKTWTTMAPALHYFIVLAHLDAGMGGPPTLANFMVFRDDPGFRVEETWDSLGMRSTGSHDVVFEELFLPESRLLNQREAGKGDRRGAAGVAWFALGIAAITIGVAQAARDYAVGYARERAPGGGATIKDFPGVRTRIARIDLLLQRSRALVYDAARAWETKDATGMKPLDRVVIAKIDTLNNCIEAVDLAMRVVGGVSLLKRRPIERYYRDVRVGLHNPPLEDRALEQLARSALDEPAELPKAAE